MSQELKTSRILPLVLVQGVIRVRKDGHINILDLEQLIPEKEQREKSWANYFAYAHETLASLAHQNGLPIDAMIEVDPSVKTNLRPK